MGIRGGGASAAQLLALLLAMVSGGDGGGRRLSGSHLAPGIQGQGGGRRSVRRSGVYDAKDGRQCTTCASSAVAFGEAGADGEWASLVCRECARSRDLAEEDGTTRGKREELREGLVKLNGRCSACNRRATFGQALQGALHCKRHMVQGDIDTSNRQCNAEGCKRQPSFGEASTGVTVSCAKHKKESFVNLKGRLCRHPEGCSKLPCFGLEGGIPLMCADHKSPRHVGLTQRARCQCQGCGKQPTFGDPSSRVIMYCKLHKRQTDVDLRNMRCQHAEGCDKWATYGNTTQPRLCQQHHTDGQVRVGGSNGAMMAERRACPRCGKAISRRNLSKHRSGSLCRRSAILAPRSSRIGRDATTALKGRIMGRHPSLGAPAAPLELFMEATRQVTNYSLTLEGQERVFFSSCEACMQTKKGLRYCRALKKHTADDCNATSMALRKTSPFLGVGWSGQKKKWRVRVTIDPGKTVHVGFFETELDAARAYDAYIITHTPESPSASKLNFPRVSLATFRPINTVPLSSSGNSSALQLEQIARENRSLFAKRGVEQCITTCIEQCK